MLTSVDRKKLGKFVLFTVICLGLFCLSISPVFADVGNNNRYNSGGSYDSGDSFGDSGFLFYMIFQIIRLFGPIGFVVVMVIIIIGFMLSSSRAKAKPMQNSMVQPMQSSGANENDIIAKIQKEDENFSAEEFKQFASECFVTLQSAWTKREWRPVRPFESDTLFNMHQQQLQDYIDQKRINVIERVNVAASQLISHEVQGDKEIVAIQLEAFMKDYVIDEATKNVVEGDQNKDFHNLYRLEFIRTFGVKTKAGKQLSTTNCPNCGAPTTVTSSGECEYCSSIITSGNYSWVLNELSVLKRLS